MSDAGPSGGLPQGNRSARGQLGRLSTYKRSAPRTSRWTSRDSFEESFRMFRSNLSVSLNEIDHPVVMVTSSHPNEGKTVVCTKLALSFAQAGKRVVLVDLDLRNPASNRLLRTHNEFGISDVLTGQKTLRDCLQHLEIQDQNGRSSGSIYFLGTGAPVHNPVELLGSSRAARTLDGLAKQSDIVLLDSPPVLPVADALVIGRVASGAILVVEAGRTAFQAVQQSKDLLIRNQTRLLGIVMNKFLARDVKYMQGYYGYGYGTDRAPDGVSSPLGPIANNGSTVHEAQ